MKIKSLNQKVESPRRGKEKPRMETLRKNGNQEWKWEADTGMQRSWSVWRVENVSYKEREERTALSQMVSSPCQPPIPGHPGCHINDTSITGQIYSGSSCWDFSERASKVLFTTLPSECMNHHFYLIQLYANQDRWGEGLIENDIKSFFQVQWETKLCLGYIHYNLKYEICGLKCISKLIVQTWRKNRVSL